MTIEKAASHFFQKKYISKLSAVSNNLIQCDSQWVNFDEKYIKNKYPNQQPPAFDTLGVQGNFLIAIEFKKVKEIRDINHFIDTDVKPKFNDRTLNLLNNYCETKCLLVTQFSNAHSKRKKLMEQLQRYNITHIYYQVFIENITNLANYFSAQK